MMSQMRPLCIMRTQTLNSMKLRSNIILQANVLNNASALTNVYQMHRKSQTNQLPKNPGIPSARASISKSLSWRLMLI